MIDSLLTRIANFGETVVDTLSFGSDSWLKKKQSQEESNNRLPVYKGQLIEPQTKEEAARFDDLVDQRMNDLMVITAHIALLDPRDNPYAVAKLANQQERRIVFAQAILGLDGTLIDAAIQQGRLQAQRFVRASVQQNLRALKGESGVAQLLIQRGVPAERLVAIAQQNIFQATMQTIMMSRGAQETAETGDENTE